jgi:FlaA1/EpsC-like NDP-sugar epimerase
MDPKPIELRDLLGRGRGRDGHQQCGGVDFRALCPRDWRRRIDRIGTCASDLAQFRPRQLVLTDNSEYNTYMLDKEIREAYPDLNVVTRLVSVRDKARLRELFLRCRPDVVFHAAALKHVPLVQENPIEGITTNVLGTRNVVDAAIENDVSTFIMISTDKAVNPTNVMGATKRAAEAYCQTMDLSMSQKTRFKTVRFGNVLGSNGSVVPRFQEQIAAGGPVTVTHPNIVRYFMTIPEAVRLVLHATAHGLNAQSERGKITVLDMGDPVRIVDLAERMIQLAGFKPNADIDIVFSGLRPGEKLYEELFDPSEVQDATTKDGYVVANPRVVDSAFLMRALDGIEAAVLAEDEKRALELLRHIVPEYKDSTADLASKVQVARDMEVRAI